MKFIPFSILVLFFVNLSAQPDLELIKTKNEDKTVDVSIINHSTESYNVLVKIEMQGMTSSAKLPITVKVKPNSTALITKLTPISGEKTQYSINFQAVGKELSGSLKSSGITIYTKNKHKRSTQLLIYLEENGIKYNEVNISYNQDSKRLYEEMLDTHSIEKRDARIPVVIYKSEVYSDIRKVPKWCKENLSAESRFVKKGERKY